MALLQLSETEEKKEEASSVEEAEKCEDTNQDETSNMRGKGAGSTRKVVSSPIKKRSRENSASEGIKSDLQIKKDEETATSPVSKDLSANEDTDLSDTASSERKKAKRQGKKRRISSVGNTNEANAATSSSLSVHL